MDNFTINLNTPVTVLTEINIDDILLDGESFIVTMTNNDIKNFRVGQVIYFVRYIEQESGVFELLREASEIIEINSNSIRITLPTSKVYSIENIEELFDKRTRVITDYSHNIFQQDLEDCIGQEVYFLNDEREIIVSATTKDFSVPWRFEDKTLTVDECLIKVEELDSCNKCESGANVFDYVFLPEMASVDSLLINSGITYDLIKDAKYISFKYNPFIFDDDGKWRFYEDKWFKELKDLDDCNIYKDGRTRTMLASYDACYKLDLGLSSDDDETGLGNEDIFSSSLMDSISDSLVPDIIDMERIKYVPAYENTDTKEVSCLTGITFYLHFRERAKIKDSERATFNSIYTSGNVYYDTWHIDAEERDFTWWNEYNVDNVLHKECFDTKTFTEFHTNNGKKSDLIGYLNFTDNDIFYRKKKVGESFLRLSFYTSKDPIEQKLLYYSTIFLDEGELYGKYIKQLQLVKKNGAWAKNHKTGLNRINENAFVVLYSGGTRVDSKITVTNEYNITKSSEGFNLYLFAEDKDFDFENGEKTIYMKVEFNHAGNGKTTPLIMWPKDKNGEFCSLTTNNFIDSLYIPIKLIYNEDSGRYVYTIIGGDVENYNLDLVLYEPKLDMVEEEYSPNDIPLIYATPNSIIYNRNVSSANTFNIISNVGWEIKGNENVQVSHMKGQSGSTQITISSAPSKAVVTLTATTNDEQASAQTSAFITVYQSAKFRPYLKLSVDELYYTENGRFNTFEVISNVDWNIEFEDGVSGKINDGKYVEITNFEGNDGDVKKAYVSTKEDSNYEGIIKKEISIVKSETERSEDINNVVINLSIVEDMFNSYIENSLSLINGENEISITGDTEETYAISIDDNIKLRLNRNDIKIEFTVNDATYKLDRKDNEVIIYEYQKENINKDVNIEITINETSLNIGTLFVGYEYSGNSITTPGVLYKYSEDSDELPGDGYVTSGTSHALPPHEGDIETYNNKRYLGRRFTGIQLNEIISRESTTYFSIGTSDIPTIEKVLGRSIDSDIIVDEKLISQVLWYYIGSLTNRDFNKIKEGDNILLLKGVDDPIVKND